MNAKAFIFLLLPCSFAEREGKQCVSKRSAALIPGTGGNKAELSEWSDLSVALIPECIRTLKSSPERS